MGKPSMSRSWFVGTNFLCISAKQIIVYHEDNDDRIRNRNNGSNNGEDVEDIWVHSSWIYFQYSSCGRTEEGTRDITTFSSVCAAQLLNAGRRLVLESRSEKLYCLLMRKTVFVGS